MYVGVGHLPAILIRPPESRHALDAERREHVHHDAIALGNRFDLQHRVEALPVVEPARLDLAPWLALRAPSDSPVRSVDCPVMNVDRPAVELCSA
jgi:hypothetical protein